ncbi:MAG: HNH endonuclease [Planctomycetota bacterium]
MSILSRAVLVLNQGWQPIDTTTVRNAVSLVYRNHARVIDPESYATFDFSSWRDAASYARRETAGAEADGVRGVGWRWPRPEVIVLSSFDRLPKRRRGVTRRNLFARDRNQCQYCGRNGSRATLNLDHVVPRSRGGDASWENLVVSCVRCNQRKANRTPQEAGMRLRRKPARPLVGQMPLLELGELPPESWEAFLSTMYWDIELD